MQVQTVERACGTAVITGLPVNTSNVRLHFPDPMSSLEEVSHCKFTIKITRCVTFYFHYCNSETVEPSVLYPHIRCLCSLYIARNFYLEGGKVNNKELSMCGFGRNFLHQNFLKN